MNIRLAAFVVSCLNAEVRKTTKLREMLGLKENYFLRQILIKLVCMELVNLGVQKTGKLQCCVCVPSCCEDEIILIKLRRPKSK